MRIKIMPRKKPGNERPSSAVVMTLKSILEYCLTAAVTPIKMARPSEMRIAVTCIFMVSQPQVTSIPPTGWL